MNESVGLLGRANKKSSALIAGVLLYCLSFPYFFWPIVLNPYWNFILGMILAYIFYANKAIFSSKVRMLLIAFLAILVLYWRTSGYNIFFFLLLSPVLMIPFCNDSFANKAYQYFFTIYSVVIAISIVEYILAVLGVISPLFTIPPLNELKGDVYKVYFTMITLDTPPVRFSGSYDEPGVVGTMSAIMLAKENFNYKDKRVIVVFLAGLLSMSLFFYIAVFICWVINILRKKKLITSVLLISAILSFAVFIIMRVPVLTEKIADRLSFDERTESFAGDNRVDKLIVADYLDSMEGRTFWFGIEDKEGYLDLVEGSSSIFNTIIVHGWLFIICYSLYFVTYFYSYKERRVPFAIFVFLFLATIYQRPFMMFSYFFIFLFTFMARNNSEAENR